MLRPKSGKDAGGGSNATVEEQEQPPPVHPDPVDLDRLTELERALERSRKEQDAMREELEKLRNHGQVYRDTIDDYRRQLSITYTQSNGSGSPHLQPTPINYSTKHTSPRLSQRLSQDNLSESLADQNQTLRAKIHELQEQLAEQDDALLGSHPILTRPRDSTEWDAITNRLHRTEKESQERLQQLLDLKHSISALTRMDSQVTDSDLAERADQLYHRIREWVISNYRRTKLDFNNATANAAKAFTTIHPQYSTIPVVDRLPFYQAVLSNALMQIFREQLCIGLPDSGPLAPIRHLASNFLQDASVDFREWRRTTIRVLESSNARQNLLQERERLVHQISNDIQHQLFSITSVNLTPQAQASLVSILNTAMDLQQKLLLQKARYQLTFFSIQDPQQVMYFDDATMEPINDLDGVDGDGDVIFQRRFKFCVFPCLEKFGDEFGDKTEVKNILLKAKVCCEPT